MSTLQENLDAILLDKNTNLLPENLKAGVNCLGINGTYEGSGGAIKQFSTIEEMNNSTGNKEGDLAVVYRSEVKNATVDSKFQVATFPDTVVLDTAITDYVDVRYRAVDDSVMFDCWGELSSSRFSMDCYSETVEVRIEYTSSDGITYTRTDTTGNPVDFGTEIYYERAEYWNDAIGKFIQVGGNVFEGLYEYTKDENKLIFPTLASVSYDIDSAKLQFNGETINTIYDVSVIKEIIAKMNSEITDFNTSKQAVLYINNDNQLCIIPSVSSDYNFVWTFLNDNNLFGIRYGNSSHQETSYVLDLKNKTYSLYKTLSDTVIGDKYCIPIEELNTKSYWYIYNNNGDKKITFELNYENYVNSEFISNVNSTNAVYGNSYKTAKTQLTLSSPDELLPKKIAYGKNGVVTGDGSIYSNLDNGEIQTNILGLKQIYPGEMFSYYGFNDILHSAKISNNISPHKYTPIKQIDSINTNVDFTIGIDDTKCNKNIILNTFGEDTSNPWKRLYGYVKNNRYFGLYQANDSFKYKYAIFELFTDKEPVNILEWSSPLNHGSSYASDTIKYNIDGNVYIIYNTYNDGEPRFVLDRVDMNTQTKTTVINDTLPYYIKTGRRMEMYDRWILVTTVDKDLNHAHTYLYDTVDNIVRLDNEITGTSTFSNTSTIHVILDEDTNVYYLLLSSFNRVISIYSYNIENGVLNNFTNIYTSSSGISTLPISGVSYGTLDGNELVSYLGCYAINTKSGEVKVLTCNGIPSVSSSNVLFDYNNIKYSDYILSGITCTNYDLSNNTISLSYLRKYQTIIYMAVKEYPNTTSVFRLENDNVYCIINQLPYCRLKLQNYTISEDTNTYYFVTTVTTYNYCFGLLFNTYNTISQEEYDTAIDTANEILGEEV